MKVFSTLLALAISFAGFSQLVDGGFEGGLDASGWNQTSTTFGTPLCDASCSANYSAFEGDWYCWFGGALPGTAEEGHIGQEILIPNGNTATITCHVWVAGTGDDSPAERVDIYMDNQPLLTISVADSLEYPEWTLLTLDVSDFADNDVHTFGLNGYSDSGSNIFFDSFILTVNGEVSASVSELMNNEVEMTVFPNPASEMVNLQFNQAVSGTATVRVFDVNGRVVSQENLNEIYNARFTMDTRVFETGMYVIEVTNGDNIFTQRFSVVR
jgi:hypothetical protein